MDSSLQRDLGRIESKVESQSEDIKTMKADLNYVKTHIDGLKGQKQWKTEQLGLVAIFSAVVTQFINTLRPFFS